jgi:hypothetical protein
MSWAPFMAEQKTFDRRKPGYNNPGCGILQFHGLEVSKMMRVTRATAVPLAALVLALIHTVGPALAQQPTQAQINAIRQACRADYQAHCSSVPTGGPEALTCLKENSTSLSASCRRAVAAAGSAPSAQGRSQTASPPPAPSPGAGAPAAPASRAPAVPMTPRQEAFLLRRACGEDFRAYCGDVPPGGGRIIACLEENRPYLSRQCRSAITSARQGR